MQNITTQNKLGNASAGPSPGPASQSAFATPGNKNEGSMPPSSKNNTDRNLLENAGSDGRKQPASASQIEQQSLDSHRQLKISQQPSMASAVSATGHGATDNDLPTASRKQSELKSMMQNQSEASLQDSINSKQIMRGVAGGPSMISSKPNSHRDNNLDPHYQTQDYQKLPQQVIPVSSIKYQSKKRLDTDEGVTSNGTNMVYNKVGRPAKDDSKRIPLSNDKRSSNNDEASGQILNGSAKINNDSKNNSNNRRSYQLQDSNNSYHTASSSIMKHAKSLYQFIVPVAQLNLNVSSNASNQADGSQGPLRKASGQNIDGQMAQFHGQQQQNYRGGVGMPAPGLNNQNQQEFMFDREEIAMQLNRLPRSQAQGAAQGRFAMLGERQMSGNNLVDGSMMQNGGLGQQPQYHPARDRSGNHPRMIGSLGNTILPPGSIATQQYHHHRDISHNTMNSAGMLGHQNNLGGFGRMNHDQSAAQFAHLDILTNYEANQSMFSGHGMHPQGSISQANIPAPRFGAMAYQQQIGNHHIGQAREMSNPILNRSRQPEAFSAGQWIPQSRFDANSNKVCRTQRDYGKKQSNGMGGNGLAFEIGKQQQTAGFDAMAQVESTGLLKIKVHYVKINIPQSIRMQVQCVFSQQSNGDTISSRNLQKEKSSTTSSKAGGDKSDQQIVITKNKCRIDSVQTVKQQVNDGSGEEKEVTIKKANFNDQELQIKVKMDPVNQNVQQKLTLKLLAVNNEQTKLIGLIHYNFMTSIDEFKPLDNALLKFQRAIDSDACICISTSLEPSHTPSSEYGVNMFGQGQPTHAQSLSINQQISSKNQTYDTMSQLVGNDGYLQRPIRKFQKNSTDEQYVDFSQADDMGLETKEAELDDNGAGGLLPVGQHNNSSVQVFDAMSPNDTSKDAISTKSQRKNDNQNIICQKFGAESAKKQPHGINLIQNSSAKMKLPQASAQPKGLKDRIMVVDNAASVSANGFTHQQSHSSSFITDHKPPSRDQRDEAQRNAFGPTDDEPAEDRSVTMTTFHNGNMMMDGAFREEEDAADASQLPPKSTKAHIQNSIQDWNGATNTSPIELQIPTHLKNPGQNFTELVSPDVNTSPLVNFSNLDGKRVNVTTNDDNAPSDSEQQFPRNSISHSPTRNRKPIQNSQPKTNLQVDFANLKTNESKMNQNNNDGNVQNLQKLPPRQSNQQIINRKIQTPNRNQNNLSQDYQNYQRKRDNSQDVRATIKTTFNILYNKLQNGVITTINNALEERSQGGMDHGGKYGRPPMVHQMAGKRSLSSQAPVIRSVNGGMAVGQHPMLHPQMQSSLNFKPQTPVAFEDPYHGPFGGVKGHPFDPSIGHPFDPHGANGHPPLRRPFQSPGPSAQPTGVPPAGRQQTLNAKSLQTEIAVLRQEKQFLEQRMKQQGDQHAMQVDSLKDRIERQEQRVTKRDKRVKDLLDDVKNCIREKIGEDVDTDPLTTDDADAAKNKELVYEQILALVQRQNNVIQMMKDRANFMEQEKKEREEESQRVMKEYCEMKELIQKEQDAKASQDDAFNEEKEAQEMKMKIQISQIEELTKEKMENTELIKVQDRLVGEQEAKIKELEKQLKDQKDKTEEISTMYDGKKREAEKFKKDADQLKSKLENQSKEVVDLEEDRVIYKESEDQLKRQIKSLNDNNLQNEKIQYKLKHEIGQHQGVIDKMKKEISQLKQEREEMMEHNREVTEALKLTEFQLIQAKSSWAESECEREQLFNRVQELEDKFDNTSKRSYQSRKE